ncbi:MAG: prephenate dehydrogenase/arogenate dehydrogenase family protein [Gammaproteobacteria bacterium]|nr:prephenate dehydrogenase/arogenate dehydrogenase family protein [Gammaproteobacteria bacterium]MCP5135861.1 prephenate dehydrogenase/arogenate dehydrogenase family protein [Gammaproteobacteria bacterium]
MRLRRLTIIGVGLIGGSLSRALRRAGVVDEVVGSSRNADHLQRAVDLGVIDRFDTDMSAAVAGADMVVVAVPLGAMENVFRAIAPVLSPGAVVTDAGSSKASVVAAVEAACGGIPHWFVPGHPIAGAERSGVEASFSDLYEGRRVILTPVANTDPKALSKVRAMWERTGAHVTEMGVAHHDEVLAATSHLPHILAYGLVDTLANLDDHDEIFAYAAGGFRDFTRIASSDPTMWRDICLSNRTALLKMLDFYTRDLAVMREMIDAGDGEALFELFARAKSERDGFVG